MPPISISSVIACHACPLRFYLEQEADHIEPARYTFAKQISYHLGTPLDADVIWEDVRIVAPETPDECEATVRAWVEQCRQTNWREAAECDVRVASARLNIAGTIDRLFDDEPVAAILRSTEAPEAGIYTADRLRAACLLFCINETIDPAAASVAIEYVPSGISRTCIPQPRDRRNALRAIRLIEKIRAGHVPKKPHDAPCEGCYLADHCTGTGAKRLTDLL